MSRPTDYLAPKTDHMSGGSYSDEIAAGIIHTEYLQRVQATPSVLRLLLQSDIAVVRGLGAVAAAVIDMNPAKGQEA